jgi:hypothetical protein
MASTYTDRLRLEKQGSGENPNSWGTILNQNVIDLLDDAIAGYAVVSVSGTPLTLSETNGAPDQSRNASLEFSGTLTANVTITVPAEEKQYFLRNNSTGAFSVIVKTAGGTALTLEPNQNILAACDGTNIYYTGGAITSITSLTVNNLSVVSAANFVNGATFASKISGADAVFSGVVSANEIDAPTGSFSTKVSATAVSAVSVSDAIGNLRVIPTNVQGSAYTLVLSDVGKCIVISTGGITIPANTFTAGDAISFYNNSGSSQTITQGTSVTMFLAGTATTGNRTLDQRGIATVLHVGSDNFVISGAGLS